MLLHDRTNTSSAYLVNLHTAQGPNAGYCAGNVLLSLVYCVFCFYPMRFFGRSVDNDVIAKNDVLSSEGPRSAGGAPGPNAGKDGTGSRFRAAKLTFRAAVSVFIGPCSPALLESYLRKCAYCCIIEQIK